MNSQRPTTSRPTLTVPRSEAASQISSELEKWRALSNRSIQTRGEFEEADADKSKLRRYTHEVLLSLFDSDKISNEFAGNLGITRSGNDSVAELTADLKRICTFNIRDLESILERLRFFPETHERSTEESKSGNQEIHMGFDAKVFNVLIASPNDVGTERDAVESAIHKWNSEHGEHENVILQPRRWEIDTRPDMTDPPQAVVNKQLVDKCDLLLGIFWTRLGTPTDHAESGTVEEIDRFLNSGRPVMLYFSEKPIPQRLLDDEQYRRLREFKSDIGRKGLIDTFTGGADLRGKVDRHVTTWVRELAVTKVPEISENDHRRESADITSVPDLRPEAEHILVAANDQSSGGKIYYKKHQNGLVVQVGATKFEASDGRRLAVLTEAIRELVEHDLLDQKSESMYEVTHRGYIVIDMMIDARENPTPYE